MSNPFLTISLSCSFKNKPSMMKLIATWRGRLSKTYLSFVTTRNLLTSNYYVAAFILEVINTWNHSNLSVYHWCIKENKGNCRDKKKSVSETKQMKHTGSLRRFFISINNISLAMITHRIRNEKGLVLGRCAIKTEYTATCQVLLVTVC